MAFVPALPEGRDRNGDFLFPFRYYTPRHESWPYTPADFKRVDESPDFMFYATPRYTTYLDPQAIEKLRAWYSMQLPHTGRILDLCASSRSYYPYQVEDAVWNKQLEVLGIGMNLEELRANSVLQTENSRKVHDLNKYPNVVRSVRSPNLKAVTCALGIEYLTAPLEVLKSLRACMVRGAKVHIVVSNTCAWQKAIVKWKAAAVEETLRMVRGFREIHFVLLQREGGIRNTPGYKFPLWAVTATNEEAYCNGWHVNVEDGMSDEEIKDDDNGITPGLATSKDTVSEGQSNDNDDSKSVAGPMTTGPDTSGDTAVEVQSNDTDDSESYDSAMEAQSRHETKGLRQC